MPFSATQRCKSHIVKDPDCTVGIATLSIDTSPDFQMEVPAHELVVLLIFYTLPSFPMHFVKVNSLCCLVINNNAAAFYSNVYCRHRGIIITDCLFYDTVG